MQSPAASCAWRGCRAHETPCSGGGAAAPRRKKVREIAICRTVQKSAEQCNAVQWCAVGGLLLVVCVRPNITGPTPDAVVLRNPELGARAGPA
eukprot:77679-Alexandrium_andersonii.AAC.1